MKKTEKIYTQSTVKFTPAPPLQKPKKKRPFKSRALASRPIDVRTLPRIPKKKPKPPPVVENEEPAPGSEG